MAAFDFPATPASGQRFTPPGSNKSYVWNGLAWQVDGGGLTTAVIIADTAPTGVSPGSLFWESDTGNSFIFYDDGSSKQWVQFNVSAPSTVSVINTKETIFTASGTFTPDARMLWCEVTGWGGGGGGGGCAASGASAGTVAAGGNAGAKSYVRLDKAAVGASQTVTIGAGGAGGTGANGNPGGATTFGSLLSAAGGEGGVYSGAPYTGFLAGPSRSATGDLRGWTSLAQPITHVTGSFYSLASSGQNEWGGGVGCAVNANGVAAAANTGAGGPGTTNGASQPARTGGTGGSGILIVKEFLRG